MNVLKPIPHKSHLTRFITVTISVKSFQVQDSIIVFELLWEKNKEIPEDLKQSLLELVAFYNESEAVEEGDPTRGVLPNQSPWITDGFVAGQYNEG